MDAILPVLENVLTLNPTFDIEIGHWCQLISWPEPISSGIDSTCTDSRDYVPVELSQVSLFNETINHASLVNPARPSPGERQSPASLLLILLLGIRCGVRLFTWLGCGRLLRLYRRLLRLHTDTLCFKKQKCLKQKNCISYHDYL